MDKKKTGISGWSAVRLSDWADSISLIRAAGGLVEACPNTHTHTPGRTSVFELTAALLYHISATLRALCPLAAEPLSCRQTHHFTGLNCQTNGANLIFLYIKNKKKYRFICLFLWCQYEYGLLLFLWFSLSNLPLQLALFLFRGSANCRFLHREHHYEGYRWWFHSLYRILSSF